MLVLLLLACSSSEPSSPPAPSAGDLVPTAVEWTGASFPPNLSSVCQGDVIGHNGMEVHWVELASDAPPDSVASAIQASVGPPVTASPSISFSGEHQSWRYTIDVVAVGDGGEHPTCDGGEKPPADAKTLMFVSQLLVAP